MEIIPKQIDYYYTADDENPYREWFDALKDKVSRQAIDARLARVRRGLMGDHKWVGQGVWELRIDVGPGFRIYYGEMGRTVVLLLYGGHKKTQKHDIKQAQEFWADYKRRYEK